MNKIILKNSDEINKIRISGKIVSKVHQEIKSFSKPGVSLKEIDELAEKIILKNNAKSSFKNYQGFPNSICTSVNDSLIHGIASDYILKSGDLLSIDVGVYKDGYHADAAKTFIVGNSSSKIIKDLCLATKEALNAAIKVAIIGNKIGDIGYEIERVSRKYNFNIAREYTGHGIGKELHEDPYVPNYGKRNQGPSLKEGMVIAIEPIFIIGTEKSYVDPKDGWTVRTVNKKQSSHDEHTIVITKEGNEILTK